MTAPPRTRCALLTGVGRPLDASVRLVPDDGISLPLRELFSKGGCAVRYAAQCAGAHENSFTRTGLCKN